MSISNPGEKEGYSVNGSLFMAYEMIFISLQSKSLIFIASSALIVLFVFEGEILFTDGGEIPGATFSPFPLREVKPTPCSSLGQVLW